MCRSRWALVVFVAVMAMHSRAEALILINEVLADPPAGIGDANGDGVVNTTQDEFIELVNTAMDPISLAGWTLSDAIGPRHVFSAGSIIPSLGFFVVFGGGAPQGVADAAIASSGTLSLNNAGDTVMLRDQTTQLIDTFIYGMEGGMDVSLTRFPDATGPFVKHTTVWTQPFSPGTTVQGRSSLPASDSSPTLPEPATLLLILSGVCHIPLVSRRQ